MFRKLVLITVFAFLLCALVSAQDWMPDENLREAIHEAIGIPSNITLTKQMMESIESLHIPDRNIQDLTGLEYAVNLKNIVAYNNQITDIQPLSNLVHLEYIGIAGCFVSDLTPVSKLINLQDLHIALNRVEDISVLISLPSLKKLYIYGNPIVDYTPLDEMPQLKVLQRHYTCNIPQSDFNSKIQNRGFPSVISAWQNIINLPHLSELERYAYHDIIFSNEYDYITTSEGEQLIGNNETAIEKLNVLKSINPNLMIIKNLAYYLVGPGQYPPDWQYWLRDEKGNRYKDHGWSEFLVDFTDPDWQDIILGRAISTKECGFYDGIFLDHWGFAPRLRGITTVEEELKARDTILKRIRAAVGDNFLILVNSGIPDVLRWKDYVNGVFFETQGGVKGENIFVNIGHTREHITALERQVSIAENSLAEPVVNCIEGYGLSLLAPDHPENLRWMRIFTTMTLTHTNGYVTYNIGAASHNHRHGWDNEFLAQTEGHLSGDELHIHDHEHYWYDFWNADLGTPIGAKSQTYNGIDGLFIREFANGWAVYNRSGTSQLIRFEAHVIGKASEFGGVEHVIEDLDGEIYLKVNKLDINADGTINILDLVIVANSLGETGGKSDVNDDGAVNILDLVLIANAFN